VKKPWKPHRPKHSGPLPERELLEWAQAKDILSAWELSPTKATVERWLAHSEKLYGPGSAERIRAHMKAIYRDSTAK
jgi:hypothetical protein